MATLRRYTGPFPPTVPAQFWETPELRAALRSRHIGKVIRAYRQHAYHGFGGLPQEQVAHWAGISQGQVSRLEIGPPLMRLDQLIRWAVLLGVPQQHIWFDLSDRPAEEHQAIGVPALVDDRAGR